MIPRRFRAASFESFETPDESQRIALDTVREWCELVSTDDAPMLALVGEAGTGKSHLLYAAVHKLLSWGLVPFCRPWYKLGDQLRYGAEGNEPAELRQRLYRARIVLIDEVRPTASTAFDDTELAKFACHAYDDATPVLITTNVNPLADVMGPAAASRFTQVIVTGPDMRQRAA